jgi:hypothetical protein
MRIISPFHDYYDTAQAFGQDERVVYHRVTREEKYKFPHALAKWFPARGVPWKQRGEFADDHVERFYFKSSKPVTFHPVSIEFFRIGFCGKLHSGIVIQFTPTSPIECFYNVDDIKTKAEKYFKKNLVDEFKETTSGQRAANWFDKKVDETSFNDWCVENKTPVVVWNSTWKEHSEWVYYNPCLNDYDFFKVMNPYQAYQELDMYISGVIGYPGIPMVEIEDKYKIVEHGFDKWSFRKIGEKSKI